MLVYGRVAWNLCSVTLLILLDYRSVGNLLGLQYIRRHKTIDEGERLMVGAYATWKGGKAGIRDLEVLSIADSE